MHRTHHVVIRQWRSHEISIEKPLMRKSCRHPTHRLLLFELALISKHDGFLNQIFNCCLQEYSRRPENNFEKKNPKSTFFFSPPLPQYFASFKNIIYLWGNSKIRGMEKAEIGKETGRS